MTPSMTSSQFTSMFLRESSEIADRLYPKGESGRRSEYLRDQGLLHAQLLAALIREGFVTEP